MDSVFLCVLCLTLQSVLGAELRYAVSGAHYTPSCGQGLQYNRLPGPGLRWRHWADSGDNGVFTEKTGSKRCLGHTFPMFRNMVWFDCDLIVNCVIG